jgi:hypothetical protein
LGKSRAFLLGKCKLSRFNSSASLRIQKLIDEAGSISEAGGRCGGGRAVSVLAAGLLSNPLGWTVIDVGTVTMLAAWDVNELWG